MTTKKTNRTKTKPKTPRTRTPPRNRFVRVVRLVSAMTVATLIFATVTGVAWWGNKTLPRLYHNAVEDLLSFTAERGLRVDDVLVEGRTRSSRGAILSKLDIERGTPIMEFSPAIARIRLEELPWVKSATVERRLPNIIYVQLHERHPLALWQTNGQMTVIDQSGDIITGIDVADFSTLPVVVGPDAPARAHEVLALIESEPLFKDKITAAVLVSGRRWNLRLENGVDIKLPEENPQAAWSAFNTVAPDLMNSDVIAVDLRIPDRLIIRTADDILPGKKRPQNEKST